MTEADDIRTETEIDEQETILQGLVRKLGSNDSERLDELVRLCVEERLHETIAGTINERTHSTAGVIGKMPVKIGYTNDPRRSRTYVDDPAPRVAQQ
jgi:hypothetical protein